MNEHTRVMGILRDYFTNEPIDRLEKITASIIADRYMDARTRAVADAIREAAGPQSTPEDLALIAIEAVDTFAEEQTPAPFGPDVLGPPIPQSPGAYNDLIRDLLTVVSRAYHFAKSIADRQVGCTIKDADRIAAKSIRDDCITYAPALRLGADTPRGRKDDEKTDRLREAYGG